MNKKKLQKPPRKYDQLYNTILTPDQEKVYRNWVNSLPINLRGDYDYDLRGAWLNGDVPSNNYHFTDKWKKPWHPTFSNESVYSTPGAEGGRWDGEEFHPSNLNRFIQDFKYGEWGANRFAKGGSYDGPPINWDYFISKMDDKSRKYNLDNLKYADNWLNKNGYTLPQRQAIIYNMWQESGGDPDAVSEDGRFAGLLQWDTAPGNRYSKIKDKSLNGQLQYIYDTTYGNMAFNGQNWMGMTRDETRANQAKFKNAKTTEEAMDIFTNGYVRPNKEVRVNRMQNYKYYFPENNDTPLVTKPWARLGSGAGASFAKGGKIPDWDPENPYHVHTEDGKKVVYSKEAYDALPDYLKQQVDEHYNEMNTFDNQYERIENPEYQMFMQRLKNSNAAINVAASKNGYWDQNWLDTKYKSGEYMFDDNGLLYYNGQTYAPWGSGNNAIVVPMRTPNGISYGANVTYYPTTVPESTIITAKKPLPTTTEVNSSIPIKNAIQKKQSEYIKANTKYYTPYYMDWYYDPITDSIVSRNQYEHKYPYSGILKRDTLSNTWLFGDKNGLPYLSEEQFMRGVRKVVSKHNDFYSNDIEDGLAIPFTIRSYMEQFPDEYLNRKQPSADEVERNATITTNDILNELSYGGSIHIKPENRGKFTAAAQRAGKSVQEYARQILANKDHYSSTLVKRANFARNFGGKK